MTKLHQAIIDEKDRQYNCKGCRDQYWIVLTGGNDNAPNGLEQVPAVCPFCNPDGDRIRWRPKEPGLNVMASSVEAGHYCTGSPQQGWVLYSRRGDGVWNQLTDREFPPTPGLVPIRFEDGWRWSVPEKEER